jgi:hypothetical protein
LTRQPELPSLVFGDCRENEQKVVSRKGQRKKKKGRKRKEKINKEK